MKFTRDGKFVAQYGKPNARVSGKNAQGSRRSRRGSNDPDELRPRREDLRRSEGQRGLHRRRLLQPPRRRARRRHRQDEAVLGRLRQRSPTTRRSARTIRPRRPAKQFRNPVHCADLSNDGCVYVCDRVNDRLQVFKADGTFVKEVFFAKNTKAAGSVWDVALLARPAAAVPLRRRRHNNRIHILQRDTLQLLTSFGDGGRQPGQFFGVHSIADRLAGQHLHDRDLGRKAHPEVREQGPRAGDPGAPGHGLADNAVILSGGWRLGAGDWRVPASSPGL